MQQEIRRPPTGVQGLYVVKFSLAWSLCGPIYEKITRVRNIYFVKQDAELHRQVERFIK